MLYNYIIIALRNVRRQKLYAGINVFGLAIGIACCVLILLYVYDEFSFDRFHEKSDRIYRVIRDTEIGGQAQPLAPVPAILAPTIKVAIPEIERTVLLFQSTVVVGKGTDRHTEEVHYASQSFFEVFSFPLEAGDPKTALNEPNAIVLSKDAARRYFGTTDPIGQRLSIRDSDSEVEVIVTGIAASPPSNSSIQFQFLLPISLIHRHDPTSAQASWRTGGPHLFVLLRDGSDASNLGQRMDAVVAPHLPDGYSPVSHRLQRLTDIHLTPGIAMDYYAASNPLYGYILASVALFILIIACINFTILSVGQSAKRIKEVGMRKVLGARRIDVMRQFWGEAFLLVGLALVAGLVLVEIFLPTFNSLVGKNLALLQLNLWLIAGGAFVIFTIVGLLAGAYPAALVSGFRPMEVFRGSLQLQGGRLVTRSLIMFQFALSILFISATLLVSRQMEYLQARDLGFRGEQVVQIQLETDYLQGARLLNLLRSEIESREDVLSLSGSWEILAKQSLESGFNFLPTEADGEDFRSFELAVAHDFLETLEIQLEEGRDFSREHPTDMTDGIIVNETFVRERGWDNPLGREVSSLFRGTGRIIGVVRDFHFQSLHSQVGPLMIRLSDDAYRMLYVRIAPHNIPATLSAIQNAWRDIAPEVPFQFTFLDDEVQRAYAAEDRWAQLMARASIFAIVIACLGLFGLATLMAERRTKEIGIRKVFGATVADVVSMLSKDFARLILIATVIAAPASYYVMSRWLESFAYRIEIDWWVFALAGAIALSIALFAVSSQAVKAAMKNPAEALRYD